MSNDYQIEKLSKQKTDLLERKLIAIATARDCEDIIKKAKTLVKSTRRKRRLWIKEINECQKWYMKTWRAMKFCMFAKKVIEWKNQQEHK